MPAAVRAVLDGIGKGASYVVRSDISKFFTKIPKSEVRKIIETVIDDADFLALYDKAVIAELGNMKELRDDAHAFPIEDIGVAQGNSLSPLLGNLLLKDFDSAMNSLPDIQCIRFIDDFVLLGPNKGITMKALQHAKVLLGQWHMTLADEKTEQGSTQQKFEFLGIEFNNGLLRPTKAASHRFLASIEALLQGARQAMIDFKTTVPLRKSPRFLRRLSLLARP